MQLEIDDKITAIETVVIEPTKEMPFEVFKECWRLSLFMELMKRLPNGKVLWDEKVTTIYDEDSARIHYDSLQKDCFSIIIELPKKFFDENLTD